MNVNKFITPLAVLAVVGMVSVFVPIARAFTEIHTVEGFVTNPDNSLAVGASVLITCNNITHFGPTDATGHYNISFSTGECPGGSLVKAQVVKGVFHGKKEGTFSGDPAGDVQMDIAMTDPATVPEFGMMTGTVASLVSGGLFLLKRRK
jgi:hypothetical protein